MRTIQNLEIIKSDLHNNLMYVKGSIPGAKNSTVYINKSVKNLKKLTTKDKIEKNQKIKQAPEKKRAKK